MISSPNDPTPVFKEIINLCPFDVVIVNKDDRPILMWHAAEHPASIRGGRHRVQYDWNRSGAPVDVFEYGKTTGLPDPRDGVAYIVTTQILDKHPERMDLLVTDSGKDAIRDPGGRVVAVRRLLALNILQFEHR